MRKVITYGTYDLLHYGHIKLLERAKELGDYLIVGVTSDDFDRTRGKINVNNSLMERVEAVRRTGLADEIIIEEYEGQKIDDIKRFGIDVFTVGSDWRGHFDYLKEYCEVVYLERTIGISSSEIRTKKSEIKLGIIGQSHIVEKYKKESKYVNGLQVTAQSEDSGKILSDKEIDAVYIVSHPSLHYTHCKDALIAKKHVLCESPIALESSQAEELYELARRNGVWLVEGIKTAYSTAFGRLILLAKSGKIGDIVSVDSVCTSLKELDYSDRAMLRNEWNSFTSWGPTALLPVFLLLGTKFEDVDLFSLTATADCCFDRFSKISLRYSDAVASCKVAKGVKSEGELIISGTGGYIYVPAPWWKTDFFEIKYENPSDNRRYFFQLEGEGIRNELASFIRLINGIGYNPVGPQISIAIADIMGRFYNACEDESRK